MPQNMEIWLEAAGEKLQLPIVPQEVHTTFETGNTVQRVHTFGEVFIFGKRGSRTIVLESWWPEPDNDYSFWACTPALKPYKFVTKINSWKDKVIKVTITGTNIRGLPFGYTTFTHGEVDASGDLKYSLTLVEYRKPTITEYKKTVKGTLKAEPLGKVQIPEVKRVAKEIPQYYVVKSGDTLEAIAKRQTGSSANWKTIYNANKELIEKTAKKYGKTSSANGLWIYPGTNLRIPT